MGPFQHVAIESGPGIAGGAIVWRYRGALQLTAVVKATFSIERDRVVALAEPEPLYATDVRPPGASSNAVTRPSDRVPYRARADVAIRAPWRAAGKPVRVALQGSGVALEKIVGPDEDVASLGALPSAVAPPGAGEVVLEIPPAFDLSLFQRAPRDQQTGYLRGDEALTLEGLHPVYGSVTTRLAPARALGLVHMASAARPLMLQADALLVDVAAMQITVSWRGSFPLASIDQLPGIHLELALELSGATLEASAPASAAGAGGADQTMTLSGPPASAPGVPAFLGGASAPGARTDTVTIVGGPGPGSAPSMAAPFPIASGARPSAPPVAGAPWSREAARAVPSAVPNQDLTLSLSDEPTAVPASATPWGGPRIQPAPAPRADFEHTMDLGGAAPSPPPVSPIVISAVPSAPPPTGSSPPAAAPSPFSPSTSPSAPPAAPSASPPAAPGGDAGPQMFRKLPKKKG